MTTTTIILTITCLVSYHCFSNQTSFEKLSLRPYEIERKKQWYRVISHGCLHADWTHLLFNMFTFYSFGNYVELFFSQKGYGDWAYLALYFGGMVAASIHDLTKQKNNYYYTSIGASGAVSAVLFASIVLNPLDKVYIYAILPIPGIALGIGYLAYCQYMAKRNNDNINHNAHFYGAIFGFIFPILLDTSLLPRFLHLRRF